MVNFKTVLFFILFFYHCVPFTMISGTASWMISLPACTEKQASNDWVLVWEDEFEGESFDESVWSKIPRGHSDWNDQMDENDACFEFKAKKAYYCCFFCAGFAYKRGYFCKFIYGL